MARLRHNKLTSNYKKQQEKVLIHDKASLDFKVMLKIPEIISKQAIRPQLVLTVGLGSLSIFHRTLGNF